MRSTLLVCSTARWMNSKRKRKLFLKWRVDDVERMPESERLSRLLKAVHWYHKRLLKGDGTVLIGMPRCFHCSRGRGLSSPPCQNEIIRLYQCCLKKTTYGPCRDRSLWAVVYHVRTCSSMGILVARSRRFAGQV